MKDYTFLPSGILPRVELREPAFRRYEKHIARAAAGSFELDPAPLKAHTFCARFRDACLGYKRYAYASSQIPKGFDPSTIKLHELANGHVYIQSTQTTNLQSLKAADRDAILALAGKLERKELVGPYLIHVATPEERAWVHSLYDNFDIAVRDEGEGVVSMV